MMRAYVLRPCVLRLGLTDREFESVHIKEMREILIGRQIPRVAADEAIFKTLKAAAEHQFSSFRLDRLRTNGEQSEKEIDRLICKLRSLSGAISRLPPIARGKLNERVYAVLSREPFDTEVFIEVIETTKEILQDLSPKILADDARSMIEMPTSFIMKGVEFFPMPGSPPLIAYWESVPAATRVEVERIMRKSGSRTSLVGWLNSLAELIDQERPVRKRAPLVDRKFTLRVASILAPFNIRPTRLYSAYAECQVGSIFQRYCNAALAAFGDNRRISGRQISNLKTASALRRSTKGPYRH
jgi:hypothetical protein